MDFDGDNVEDTGDQVTTYTFGTTKGATAGDSEIGSGHLLQEIEYPDSASASDVVTFAYNAQSQRIYKQDQAGNVLEYDYDDSGRPEHERATTIDADFDDAIKRITQTYDDVGRLEKVTQYDNAAVGSGAVQDEVKYLFDDWWNIRKIRQDNDSAVGASGYYEISYAYEKQTTGRNTVRRSSMTAPSGNVFDFKFRSTGGRHDDDCSRVTQINDGATLLVLYEYLGGSTVVEKDYTGIDVMQRRYGATSGDYPGFDRFNRIVEDTWTKDLATDVNIYDVDITYDRNSNITELDEVGVHVGFDAKITIDGLDRVTNVQEGTLSGGSLTSETREQTWTLMDQVGNWEHVKLDLNGDGDWSDADEYNDDRTYNDVNEIAGRDTDDDGTDNYTLTHDETGGLLDDGQNYEYKYDVWYRLRSISDQSQSLVSEFRYNGLAQRISEHSDTDGDGDVDVNDDWHHTAHDERWRPTAAFINTATSPRHEIAYDPRPGAIDQLVLWDNDTDDDGTLDSRHWYCQNRHDDVVSLITDSGSLVESTRYGPYGVPFGIPAGDANSDGDNDSTDQDQIQTWINTSAYDARGDVDLDGDVDTNDKSAANAAPIGGATLGRGTLGVLGRIRGWSGRPHWGPSAATIFVRHRILINGIWSTRDPEEYVEGPSMYEFAGSSPITRTDPYGLASCRAGQPETWPNKDDHGSIWSTVCGPSNDRWEYQLWATIIEPTTTKDGSCADSADKPCHLETGLNLGVVARPEGSSLPFRQLGVWGRDPQYQQSVIRQCEMWHGPGPNGRPNKKCKGGQITWGTFPPNGDRGTLPPPSESNGSMILDMSCSCLSSGVQCVSGVVIESNDGTCRLRANILFPCGACD